MLSFITNPYNDNPYNDSSYNDNPYNDISYNDSSYNDSSYNDGALLKYRLFSLSDSMASTNSQLAHLTEAARDEFSSSCREDCNILRAIECLCAIPISYECVIGLASR